MNNELVIEAPEGLPFLDYSREFDALVTTLFRAYTDREVFEQWFGPEGMPLAVHRFDPQTGGGFATSCTVPTRNGASTASTTRSVPMS